MSILSEPGGPPMLRVLVPAIPRGRQAGVPPVAERLQSVGALVTHFRRGKGLGSVIASDIAADIVADIRLILATIRSSSVQP